jgi:hypothetical protein
VGEDATLTSQLPGTTPEPGTLSLFGIGLVALAFIRRSVSRLRS